MVSLIEKPNQGHGILTFPDRTMSELAALGFTERIKLTGKSIRELRQMGHPFYTTQNEKCDKYEEEPSRQCEVVFMPTLFLPDSNNKTLEEQLAMVAQLSENVAHQIPGVEAVIGSTSDYVELILNYQQQTGKSLFGENNSKLARTSSRLGVFAGDIGYFQPETGIRVHWLPANSRYSNVWTFPFVAPTR